MRQRTVGIVAATLLAAVLSGCAPKDASPTVSPSASGPMVSHSPLASSSPSTSPSANPSSTTTPALSPAALVLGVDSLTLVTDDGTVLGEVDFAMGYATDSAAPALLSLVTSVLGPAPDVSGSIGYPMVGYSWGDVDLAFWVDDNSWAQIGDDGSIADPDALVLTAGYPPTFSTPETDGIALRTSQGIVVGDSLVTVLATLGAIPGPDTNGDGTPDSVELEYHEEPGTTEDGEGDAVGHTWVEAEIKGGVVSSISGGGDIYDI